jgi:hypothetical protein
VTTCTYADDDYLLVAFPAVQVLVAESWQVNVVAAAEGEYAVDFLGASYPYAAGAGESAADIALGLLGALSGQMQAAVGLSGGAGLLVVGASATPLDLEVSGPNEGDITATLLPGSGDANAAQRAFWLERAKCGLPPCCAVTCKDDYTLMHAALAAHYLLYYGNTGKTGSAAGDWNRMRLGPAELSKGVSAWAASSPADADLAKTGPGQLFLALRSKYVFGVAVSCGGPCGSPGGWGGLFPLPPLG